MGKKKKQKKKRGTEGKALELELRSENGDHPDDMGRGKKKIGFQSIGGVNSSQGGIRNAKQKSQYGAVLGGAKKRARRKRKIAGVTDHA